MKFQGLVKIIQKNWLTEETVQFIVERPEQLETIHPGQFFQLKSKSVLLRRPISVSGIGAHTLEFTIKILGEGTQSLSQLKVEETLDIIGPLGNGYEVGNESKVLIVGGGIGVAPQKGLIESLSPKTHVTSILGFKEDPYLLDSFKALSNDLIIMSEKNQNYQIGFVTTPLEALLSKGERFEAIYCCGPEAMFKSVLKVLEKYHQRAQFLMEEKMACGIGACLVCTCKIKDKNKQDGFKHAKMCKDGPMFYSDEVMIND